MNVGRSSDDLRRMQKPLKVQLPQTIIQTFCRNHENKIAPVGLPLVPQPSAPFAGRSPALALSSVPALPDQAAMLEVNGKNKAGHYSISAYSMACSNVIACGSSPKTFGTACRRVWRVVGLVPERSPGPGSTCSPGC